MLTQRKHRILIVDDQSLFRASVRALLEQDPGVEIVGEAGNGRDAIRAVDELAPHLVLIELSMPEMNGIEAIAEIKRRHPQVRVLVLTQYKAESYVHSSLKAGADGYLPKDATQEELRMAVRSVLNGKTYLNADVAANVVSGYLEGGRPAGTDRAYTLLTQREREVLKLVAAGKSNKSVAELLRLSVKTAEKHRSNLMGKLHLHNVSGLTAYAIANERLVG